MYIQNNFNQYLNSTSAVVLLEYRVIPKDVGSNFPLCYTYVYYYDLSTILYLSHKYSDYKHPVIRVSRLDLISSY